jgi:hypothetical protein
MIMLRGFLTSLLACCLRTFTTAVLQMGPELPEPSAVAWDPTLRYLALAYLRQIQIFRAQPQLESLGSLPIAGTTSVAWGVRQLYIATPTSVLLAFVAAEERSGAAFSLLDMGPTDNVAGGSTLQVGGNTAV